MVLQTEVAHLRRALEGVDWLAQQQAHGAVASAYDQGRKEAAPAQFKRRAQINELAGHVFDHLECHAGGFCERAERRRSVEVARQYRDVVDRRLDLALEPLRATWPSTASAQGYGQLPPGPLGSLGAITGGEEHGGCAGDGVLGEQRRKG